MAFAELWETWTSPGGSELDTVAILTTEANAKVRRIHDRMPVVIDPADYDRWTTTPPGEAAQLTDMLRPAPDGALYMVAVTKRVDSPRNDDATCFDVVG